MCIEGVTDSRSQIMEKIKRFARLANESTREKELGELMQSNDQAQFDTSALTTRLIDKLEVAKATVESVHNDQELVKAVHRYVLKNQIQSTITLANYEDLTQLEWRDADVSTQYQPQTLSVSVVYAAFGIAETGTLLLKSSPQSPTGMNFLPDHHIVVLDIRNIVEDMESAWQRVKAECPSLPRTINLISGPSRTADIEQTIQLGAHGPKFLHVILMKRENTE